MTDRLHKQLFEVEGKELINIKFCVGNGENISESDFRDAVATKIFQIDNGLAETHHHFGDRGNRTISVAEVVARLKPASISFH